MKKILSVCLFICFCLSLQAQYNNDLTSNTLITEQANTGSGFQFDKSKLTFGGGIGLQFGTVTLINVAPQVGYNFSPKFNAGLGFTYTHWRAKFYSGTTQWKETSNFLGFSIFGRYFPIENIILSVQPEINRMWQNISNENNTVNQRSQEVVPSLLVGGGARLGSVIAMIQYDVVQNVNSPYGNRIFYSIGYMISF